MPATRDWLYAFGLIVAYFLLLGLCDPAPAAEPSGVAETIHQERTMERYLTEEEQQRLLKVLKEAACRDALGRRDDAMVRALIHSGLRIGEFSRVTVGDALAALKHKYLFVPKEHRKGFSRGVANDHWVYLTQPLRRAIEDLLKVRAELGVMDCHEGDPLVIGRAGRRMTVRALELRYKEHARIAGLARSSPHWLRHTLGMNIIRRSSARNPLGVVQRQLGHKSLASTGIYTATPREEVEAALEETAGGAGRVSRAQLRRDFERRSA